MPNQPPTSAQAHETDTPPERGRYKMYYGGELVGEGEVEVMTGDIIVTATITGVPKVYAADPPANTDRAQLRTWRQERES